MWHRACVDAASVPAPAGGKHTGRNPSDRGKLGSRQHLVIDELRFPLEAQMSAAQVHDSRFLIPLVEPILAVKGLAGRARNRRGKLHADRAYASTAHRAWLHSRGIAARIARHGVASRGRLGRWCWVVERTSGWLQRYRRLRIRTGAASRHAPGILVVCLLAHLFCQSIERIDRLGAGATAIALQAVGEAMAAELCRGAAGTGHGFAGDLVDQRGDALTVDQFLHEAADGQALVRVQASQPLAPVREIGRDCAGCVHAALQSGWWSRFDLSSSNRFGGGTQVAVKAP